MFEKWRSNLDCEFKTDLWLECESAVEGRTKVVRKIKCSMGGKLKFSVSIIQEKF